MMLKDYSELVYLANLQDPYTGEYLYLLDILHAFKKWSSQGLEIPRYLNPLGVRQVNDEPKRFELEISDQIGGLIDACITIGRFKCPVGYAIFRAVIFEGYHLYELATHRHVRRAFKKHGKKYNQKAVKCMFNDFLKVVRTSL